VSARNKRSAKAARRKDRARRDRLSNGHGDRLNDSLADVHSLDELVSLAERGATLPCGCDAHALLHEMLTDPGDE